MEKVYLCSICGAQHKDGRKARSCEISHRKVAKFSVSDDFGSIEVEFADGRKCLFDRMIDDATISDMQKCEE